MKIGIFDSGLGGLFLLKELRKKLPRYDYVYLGDTKNLPYGDKSQKQIFNLTRKAVECLFQKDCQLVILACNTASAQALTKIQQEWLPSSKYSDRRVLGVIRPTVEEVRKYKRIGIIGTRRTIDSGAYARELGKITLSKATPKLAPMIELDDLDHVILEDYLRPMKNMQAVILACTHYAIIKDEIRKILGRKVRVISQDEILPGKLKRYLNRHPEILRKLDRNGKISLNITKRGKNYVSLAQQWFGTAAKLKIVKL